MPIPGLIIPPKLLVPGGGGGGSGAPKGSPTSSLIWSNSFSALSGNTLVMTLPSSTIVVDDVMVFCACLGYPSSTGTPTMGGTLEGYTTSAKGENQYVGYAMGYKIIADNDDRNKTVTVNWATSSGYGSFGVMGVWSGLANPDLSGNLPKTDFEGSLVTGDPDAIATLGEADGEKYSIGIIGQYNSAVGAITTSHDSDQDYTHSPGAGSYNFKSAMWAIDAGFAYDDDNTWDQGSATYPIGACITVYNEP